MNSKSTQYDSFPWFTPVLENLIWFLVYALGYALFGLLSPWAGLVYLGYALVTMYLLIPMLVCTRCAYFGKLCHSGQGRLAALLFSRGDEAQFARRFKCMRFAAPVFLAPLLAGILACVVCFSWGRLGLTLAFGIVALGLTSVVTGKLACPHCRQRALCPAHQLKARAR